MVGAILDLRRKSNIIKVNPLISCGMAVLLAMIANGCGTGGLGTTASSFLRHARESEDPNIRYQAYAKLGNPRCYTDDQQKTEAAKVLAEALNSREEATAMRAILCRTLGEIGNPEARPALTRALQDPDPLVRTQACRALGKIGHPEDAYLLSRLMVTDTTRDGRVAAINALADLGTDDARIELKLVEGMRNQDPAIRVACYDALCQLSGQDLGVAPTPWEQRVQARLELSTPEDSTETEVQQASADPDNLPPLRPGP